jgi:hypothetical protein
MRRAPPVRGDSVTPGGTVAGLRTEENVRPRFLNGVRFALIAACLGIGAGAAAAPDDHPLVSRYEGSILTSKKIAESGEYALVTGRSLNGELAGEPLTGRVTRMVYANPAGRSTRDIFSAYQKALVRAGLTEIYTCEMAACGPADRRGDWTRFNGLAAAADGDPRYLAGKIAGGPATTYVALMVGRARTQLDIVEIPAAPDKSGAR